MHIGVFGGSFDPVHVGHVAVAREVLAAIGLDQVRIVPTFRQPLKRGTHRASPVDRLNMLRLAFEDAAGCIVDDCEISREGISYTIDTMRDISSRFPASKLSLIVGADTATEFEMWRDHDAILNLADLVVVTRPGQIPGLAGLHTVVPIPPIDVSASEIRRRIGAGQDITGMVPQPVWNYIRTRGIYGVGA